MDPLTLQLLVVGVVAVVGLALAWLYARSPKSFERFIDALIWDDDDGTHPDDRK